MDRDGLAIVAVECSISSTRLDAERRSIGRGRGAHISFTSCLSGLICYVRACPSFGNDSRPAYIDFFRAAWTEQLCLFSAAGEGQTIGYKAFIIYCHLIDTRITALSATRASVLPYLKQYYYTRIYGVLNLKGTD